VMHSGEDALKVDSINSLCHTPRGGWGLRIGVTRAGWGCASLCSDMERVGSVRYNHPRSATPRYTCPVSSHTGASVFSWSFHGSATCIEVPELQP